METLDYSPLFGLLYNTAVEYMDRLIARGRFIRYDGVVSGCVVTVFAYPHNVQAKIMVPAYVSRLVESVVATAKWVGTVWVMARTSWSLLPRARRYRRRTRDCTLT